MVNPSSSNPTTLESETSLLAQKSIRVGNPYPDWHESNKQPRFHKYWPVKTSRLDISKLQHTHQTRLHAQQCTYEYLNSSGIRYHVSRFKEVKGPFHPNVKSTLFQIVIMPGNVLLHCHMWGKLCKLDPIGVEKTRWAYKMLRKLRKVSKRWRDVAQDQFKSTVTMIRDNEIRKDEMKV